MGTYERRAFPLTIRSDGAAPSHIVGHAAVFDADSEEMGYFVPFKERIARGAFDDALRRVSSGKDAVFALLNHDENYVISSTNDRTLSLSVDEVGLVADMIPMDTQVIRDMVVTPITQGKINKMSFGFTVADEHEETREKVSYRIIDKIDRLFDVSPVTFPAYPTTDVQARRVARALGIDPTKLSIREGIALRSLVAAVTVRQQANDLCARGNCGHTYAQHDDGDGCEMCDCSQFMEQASLSDHMRKVAQGSVRLPAIAGAVATRSRELELHLRDRAF